MNSELLGTIIDTVLVVTIVICACATDLVHNPCGHPRKYIVRRFLNWFLVGITYASTYFGRYNMNIANQDKTYKELEITASDFGWVVTVGNISYAVFVVVNGFVVDTIGGSRAMVIGALGSGVLNLVQGLVIYFAKLKGTKAIVVICIIYAVNNYFQTFCTSAICKVAVNWYNIKERGYFSGIFGVIISLGFFFAYQINGVVYGHIHWAWIFFLPAIQLTIFGILNWIFARNTPAEAGFTYDPFTLKDSASETEPLLAEQKAEEAAKTAAPAAPAQKPTLLSLFKTVFTNPIFLVLCLIDICLGWNRDGILAWYGEVLHARFGKETTSNEFALASGGTTIGGMFGSLCAGMLSDSLFQSRRTPVAFLFYIFMLISMCVMLYAETGFAFAGLVALCAVWFNGLNGLITSTCAMDFAGSEATATAVGLLDGIQKIGSASTGAMGSIFKVHDGVMERKNYTNWIYSLVGPAMVAIILLLPVIDRKPNTPKKKEDPHPSEGETCVVVTEPEKSINYQGDD